MKKHETLVELSKKEGQGNLSEAAYWYSLEAYEMPGDSCEGPGRFGDESDREHFENCDWVLVGEDPSDEGLVNIRARVCELKIAITGRYFQWSFIPKHGSVMYVTPPISFVDLAERGILKYV